MLRTCVLPALLLWAACGTRPSPRFASPMLGTASVPLAPLPREAPEQDDEPIANRRAEPIRVSAAPRIREASAAAAQAVTSSPVVARRAELPAPNRIAVTEPLPTARVPADLRGLVGRRDKREPTLAAIAWARELGMQVVGARSSEILVWAESHDRLHDAAMPPERGDLLVFDRVNSDEPADLFAVVISRDERNVTEFLYLGGGVIRRGFVDASRPRTKRDQAGASVNTFLRTGRRWPAKGSRYLAGEHLAHVIR